MNQLQVFSFETQVIRTQVDQDGQPWWSIKDVCEALHIKNVGNASSRLDDDERSVIRFADVTNRSQEMVFVNESGLYSLILRSNKDEAKRFKKWITSEVIPTIRKTGSFTLSKRAEVFPAAEPVFRSLAAVAEIFGLEKNQALLYANKATKRETGVDFQNVLQIELKNHDQARVFTPTELGQRIGLSAIKFNRELEARGLQEKRNDVWCATEVGKTYSVLMDAGKKHVDGTPIQQLKWKEAVLGLLESKAA